MFAHCPIWDIAANDIEDFEIKKSTEITVSVMNNDTLTFGSRQLQVTDISKVSAVSLTLVTF